MAKELSFEQVLETVQNYATKVEDDFYTLIENWPEGLSEPPIPRVLGALLGRHVTLALTVVRDPFFWSADFGPLVLRPLLESWLKIEWILKEPIVRCSALAKADLIGAISKVKQLKPPEAAGKEFLEQQADLLSMLENERSLFTHETKPKIIDSRTMAHKIGGDAFIEYKRHHVRMSSCVHSTWNHVARQNLLVNPNPLHRHNFVPIWREPDIDFTFAIIATQYCDKALRLFLKPEAAIQETAHDELMVELEKLGLINFLEAEQDGSLPDWANEADIGR